MVNKKDLRRATRIAMNLPVTIESVGQPQVPLHENLARVYQRVHPDGGTVGQRFPAIIRDLSTNGAFIAGPPLPLLARVAFAFPLEGFGQVETLGWVLWRREDDCEIPRADGSSVTLPKGFGVLFEAIPLDARIAIHKLVERS